MKRIFSLFVAALVCVLSTTAWAGTVSKEDAAQLAGSFLSAKQTSSAKKASAGTTLTSTQFATRVLALPEALEIDQFYVVQEDDEDGGWVLVAADDAVQPILGYADKGTFDASADMPENLKWWLGMYNHQIKRAIANGQVASAEVTNQWSELRSGARKAKAATVVVGPLLTTTWNQSSPFNNLCPYYSGNSRSVTGCVATAMAQVMNFWEWPEKGQGSHSYNSNGTQSVNFANTTYDWANMKDSYSSYNSTQANAVATLMYSCGVAVEMNYGASSGAQTIRFPSNSTSYACAQNALWNYFKYNADSIKGYYREGASYYGYSSWTDNNWIAMLKQELNKQRPIMYAGSGDGGGHSFVCDGYRDDNYFHFNWGWGGSYDGYFTVNNLAPGGGGIGSNNDNSFNEGQDVIIGIVPNVSDKYKVTYSVANGTCGTASWTQSTVGQSCTLPNVTPNANYHFLGWSDAQGSKTANVGQAGDTYTPMRNVTLYAVMIQEASLVYFVSNVQPGFVDHGITWNASPTWSGHGQCEIDSIYEDGEGTGVVLPSVISDGGWTMQEWLIVSNGSLYIAGWPGDMFYPTQDTAYLYAYWTPDGKVYLDEVLIGVEPTSGPFDDVTTTYGWIKQSDGLTATFVAADGYLALTAANTEVSVKVGDETIDNCYSFANNVLTVTLTPEQMIEDIEISIVASEDFDACDDYSYTYSASQGVGNGKVLGAYTWNISGTGTTTAGYNSNAQSFGGTSRNQKCNSMTYVTTNGPQNCLINSININAWCTGSGGTLEVFIDNTSLGTQTLGRTSSATGYTFENTNKLKGQIKFVITNITANTSYRIFVKSINVIMADHADGSVDPGDPITVSRTYMSAGYYDYNEGEGDPLYVWQFGLIPYTFTNGQPSGYVNNEYYAHLGIAIANSPTSIVGTYNMPVWALYDLQAGGVSEYYDDNEITITYKSKGTGSFASYYIYHVKGYWYDETGQKYVIDSDVYTELSNFDTDEDITPTGDTNPRYYKVQHWLQNVDGGTAHNATNYTLKESDTETGQGGTGDTFAIYSNSYAGFIAPADQSVTLANTNTQNNPAVVNFYYDRRSYPVRYLVDNIDVLHDTVRYKATPVYSGPTPTREATEQHSYTFTGWDPILAPIVQAMTYTAQFDVVSQVTVTFDANGHGTAPAAQTVMAGQTITRPADPSETGYVFGGWYKEQGCVNAWNFSDPVNASMTLWAKWTANTHTLSWNANGGTLSGTYTNGNVAFGTAIVAPTATRTGYTFAGWDNPVPATMPDNDLAFVAQWTPNTNTAYVVKHYKQNIADNNYTIAETENLTGTTGASVSPAVKDYEGFSAPAQQTVTILADGSLVVTYNYTRKTYALTWNADGGNITGNYTSGQVKYEAPITAPANANVTKAGHIFQGWDNPVPATMPAGPLTFTAQWQVKTYSLSFTSEDENKGTVSVNPEKALYEFGDVIAIQATAKIGYSFSKWSDNNTQASRSITANDAAQSLVASFAANSNTPYIVHHFQQNITDDGWTEILPVDNLTGTTGALTNVAPVIKDYTGFDVQPYENVIIAADGSTEVNIYYVRKTFTIRFLVDGAVKQSDVLRYGATPAWRSADPTKEADAQYTYTFAGWNPAIALVSGYQDYEAKWDKTLNRYTVSFNANGHGTAPASQLVGYGQLVPEPSALSETGWTFGGWYKEATCANQWNFAEDQVTGTTELFAKWTVNKHDLAWNANGGTITSADGTYTSGLVAFGTPIVAPSVEFEGYNFIGWNPSVAETMPDDNVTYVANWQERGDIVYKVRHEKENLAGDAYVLDVEEEFTGVTGHDVTPLVKTYTGFDSPAPKTAQILADGSLVIIYQYARKSYNVTWDVNGGDALVDNGYTRGSVRFETPIIAPADPTWRGHTFHNWGKTVPSTMPAEALNFVADWTLNSYSGITFKSEDENEGTVTVNPEKDSYDFGESVAISADANEGYHFTGWSDGNNDEDRTIVVDETTTSLVATFAPNTNTAYKVKHFLQNLNNDEYTWFETDDRTGTTGALIQDAPRTIEGFITPGSQVNQVAIKGDGSSVIEYYYVRGKYSLTWNANGGVLLDNGRTEGEIKFEAEIKAAVAEWQGHTFKGWGAEVPQYMPARALNFVAQWEADTYSGITFESADETKGTVTVNPEKDEYTYGDEVTITAEANDGYEFTGWSDGSTEETRVITIDENTQSITANFTAVSVKFEIQRFIQNIDDDNFTFYDKEEGQGYTGTEIGPEPAAIVGFTAPEVQTVTIKGDGSTVIVYNYIRNKYALSWDANGGQLLDNGRTEGLVKYQAPIKAAEAEWQGHIFQGWGAEVPLTMPTEALSFVAQWKKESYPGITFGSNDPEAGTVTATPQKDEYEYGDEVTITAEANEGYDFVGWSDGSTEGTERVIVVDENTESVVAIFTPKTDTKYIVRILLQNIEDDEFTLFNEQEKTGTTGVEVSPVVDEIEGFTAPEAQTAKIKGDGSLEIEYKYLRNSYELIWDADGGDFGESLYTQGQVKFGAEIIAPANPVKAHFIFLSWDGEVPETMPANDLKLTALWQVDTEGIEIVVDGRTILSNEEIRIYDFNGRDVTGLNGNLGNGMYIVVGGGQTTKIAIFK